MRRAALAAVVIAAAVALAGCGGIPSSGSVQAGGLINEETETDFGYLPPGPQKGATQAEIVAGFIQAATNPQDNYGVAREFLTGPVARDWDPNEITQVRSGVGSPQPTGETTYTYTFSSSAFVDSAGRYSSGRAATQRLEFVLVQDAEGEWRISEAPDGIVLSGDVFNSIFDALPLYYFDSSYQYLVPDVRWFPSTSLLPTRLVSALLAGQSEWLAQGITNSEFPAGTTLDSRVTIESGVATVELSESLLEASPEARARISEQIKNTIGNVSSVVLTVNGVPVTVPDISVVPIINPQVQSQLLVRNDDGFGYVTASGDLSTLGRAGAQAVELDARAATLSRGRDVLAVLAPDGVHGIAANGDQLLLDARAGLLAPSTDTRNLVWSVPAGDASAIRAYDLDGNASAIASSIAPGTRLVSFAVSRDGSRIAMYTESSVGTVLTVYGILRTEGVPYALGAPYSVAVDQSLDPLDAAWVDDRTIATLASQSATGNAIVTLHSLGGQSRTIGRVAGGVAIVGGNTDEGLRVTDAEGDVYFSRGNSWAASGTRVSFLATQQ